MQKSVDIDCRSKRVWAEWWDKEGSHGLKVTICIWLKLRWSLGPCVLKGTLPVTAEPYLSKPSPILFCREASFPKGLGSFDGISRWETDVMGGENVDSSEHHVWIVMAGGGVEHLEGVLTLRWTHTRFSSDAETHKIAHTWDSREECLSLTRLSLKTRKVLLGVEMPWELRDKRLGQEVWVRIPSCWPRLA